MPEPFEHLLAFYYYGFHRALSSHRLLTMEGWAVTALGGAGLLIFWRDGSDLFPVMVALAGVIAGLSLVHQSVAALDQYVRVPFPRPSAGTCPANIEGAVEEFSRLMEEIDRGGWQEAYAALRSLGAIADRFSLPPIP